MAPPDNPDMILAYKAQRDHIISILTANSDSADPALVELLDSLTELIALEETSGPTIEDEQRIDIDLSQSAENGGDRESTLQEDAADLSSAEADLHAALLHFQCRVPFQHSWGQLRYSNAIVQSVESTPASDDVEEMHVRVLFMQPTHRSMVPCQFFLDGKCRFQPDQCHFSHGEVYALSKLKSYHPPDFSVLKVGSACLCAGEDGIWEHAVVTEISPDTMESGTSSVTVRIAERNDTKIVEIQQIIPEHNDLDGASDASDEDDEGTEVEQPRLEDSDDEFTPHVAWDLPVVQVSAGFAGWETHTKGMGSKLMAKMGFVTGQGLGVRPGGRTEPVPAHVLPKGRSLDYCMALKEGTKLPTVGKKRRKNHKLKKGNQPTAAPQTSSKSSIFDFLNSKLKAPSKHQRRRANQLARLHAQPSASTSAGIPQTRSAAKEAGKALNVEALKLHDRIAGLSKELDRLRNSLTRNGTTDRAAARVISERIKAKDGELSDLRRQQDALQKTRDGQKEKDLLVHF